MSGLQNKIMKCELNNTCKFLESQQTGCAYCLGCGIKIAITEKTAEEESGFFKHAMELDEEKKEDE